MSLGQMISYLGTGTPQVVSVANPLPVTLGGAIAATVTQGPGNTANPWTVQGPAAGGAASSGNPVKLGAVVNSSLPTYVAGNVGELQISTKGILLASINAANGVAASVQSGGAFSVTSLNGLATFNQNFIWNGNQAAGSWDPVTKPRTSFKLPSCAATNNAANIKTTSGTIFGITGITAVATTRWLKFFDTASAPNPAALAQLYLFPLPASQPVNIQFPNGIYFPTGIGVAIVANPADLDNTAVAAGDFLGLNVLFE